MRITVPHLLKRWHIYLAHIAAGGNSLVNPLLYGMCSEDYRQVVKKLALWVLRIGNGREIVSITEAPRNTKTSAAGTDLQLTDAWQTENL